MIDGSLVERDIIRQNDLINHMNCRFFRISQKDWSNDKQIIINNFIKFTKGDVQVNENKENYIYKWG